MSEKEPDSMRTAREQPDPKLVTRDSARQGPPGLRMLYVCLAVTIGSFVIIGLYYLYWVGQTQ